MYKVPNKIEFLTSVTTSCQEITSICETLGHKSQRLLNQILESRDDYVPDILDNNYKVSHDPGCRPETLTNEQKMYLIKLGPCQPKLSSFPKNLQMKAVNDTCCFSARWYIEYPDIEYSIEKDRVYCFVCKLFSSGMDRGNRELAWIVGFSDWRKAKGSQGKGKPGKIQAHFHSSSHNAAYKDFVQFCKQSEHVDLLLDKEKRTRLIKEEKKIQEQRDVIVMMLDISKTLARQGLAFRNHPGDSNFEQLVQLLGRHNTTMKAWLTERTNRPYQTTYMSYWSQEEYITLLGESIENKIIEEIKTAGMIGIIADTTPDVSHMDQLTVAARFVDSNDHPRERLIATVEIKDKTGEGMAKALISTISVREISSDFLKFQTYDSAASMSGIYKGAQQKLSELVERRIIYIPCTPHGSNLVIEHGCNASQIVREMYNILESLYVFFSSSTKRHDELKEKLEMTEGALQLKNLSKTRWSARPESVKAVWVSYDGICIVLDEIRHSHGKFDSLTISKANGLLLKIKSLDFIVGIMFMKNIMYKTKEMVDILQAEQLDISGALIAMGSTLKILELIKSDTDAQKNQLDAALKFAETQGVNGEEEFSRVHRLRKRPKRYDNNPESNTEAEGVTLYSYYCKEMNAVLDTMIFVLNSKYENIKSSFKPFYDVLDPNVDLKYYNTKQFEEALEILSKIFPHEVHNTIILKNEMQLFNSEFSDHVQKHPEVTKTIRSAAEKALSLYKQNKLFPRVAKVYRLFLTAPPSVCKSERSFSRLKFLKSCVRNTLSEKHLHHLMLLACEKDLTDQLDLQNIVEKWKLMKTRRIRV